MDGAKVYHFPVDKRMPTRVAEEKLGSVTGYKYPGIERPAIDSWEWLESWLSKKYVLLGWDAVKEGLVHSFKGGRVKHIVKRVVPVDVDAGERPRVETACSMHDYPIFNWKNEEPLDKVPAVLLSGEQQKYFRLCKRCAALAENGY
jgi:hypothetical protein